ncbi:MAG: hypothetical protein LIO79_08370, partial [Rikenellaceae bacterium]|nr:hypothetical protein [Rikenellaceae bacterium]
MKYIKELILLGNYLKTATDKNVPEINAVIRTAVSENPWFTRESVIMSIRSICTTLLDCKKLTLWSIMYSWDNIHSKNVTVIMAGNLPLVGFFDMLCVLVSGHNCFVRPSSKDRALILFLIGKLKEINPEIPVYEIECHNPDAVIATGSDNSNRYFKYKYGEIPHVFRKSRYSIAVLTGKENSKEIKSLHKDITSYYGLGCRNVSCLFLPEHFNYDILKSATKRISPNPKYTSRLKYYKTVLKMNKREYIDCGDFFMTKLNNGVVGALPEIYYI